MWHQSIELLRSASPGRARGADAQRVRIVRYPDWAAGQHVHLDLCPGWRTARPGRRRLEPEEAAHHRPHRVVRAHGCIGVGRWLLFSVIHAARCGHWRGRLCAGWNKLDRRSVPAETARTRSVTVHVGRSGRWGAELLVVRTDRPSLGLADRIGQRGGARDPFGAIIAPIGRARPRREAAAAVEAKDQYRCFCV